MALHAFSPFQRIITITVTKYLLVRMSERSFVLLWWVVLPVLVKFPLRTPKMPQKSLFKWFGLGLLKIINLFPCKCKLSFSTWGSMAKPPFSLISVISISHSCHTFSFLVSTPFYSSEFHKSGAGSWDGEEQPLQSLFCDLLWLLGWKYFQTALLPEGALEGNCDFLGKRGHLAW